MTTKDPMEAYLMALLAFAITAMILLVLAFGAAFVLHTFGVIDGPF